MHAQAASGRGASLVEGGAKRGQVVGALGREVAQLLGVGLEVEEALPAADIAQVLERPAHDGVDLLVAQGQLGEPVLNGFDPLDTQLNLSCVP